jgi:hypothetical protein
MAQMALRKLSITQNSFFLVNIYSLIYWFTVDPVNSLRLNVVEDHLILAAVIIFSPPGGHKKYLLHAFSLPKRRNKTPRSIFR